MGDIYIPGKRRISKTSRAELVQYELQAKEGKHFDESSMIRVGLYQYPSSVFPLRKGNKALINGYPRGFSLELMVGKMSEETIRAANPEHSKDKKHKYHSTGDTKLDIKLQRRIETFKTYPIAPGDLLQIAFIGFNYKWNDEENSYVDFFKNKKGPDSSPELEAERLKDKYSKVPTLMYEVIALDPLGEILRGKPFQGEVRRGKIPQTIGEVLDQAENLGEFELPDKRIIPIKEILSSYEIINIYAQIQIHIKYSDKKNRKKAEYQSGIKEEDVSAKGEKEKKEEFFSDFLGDLKKTQSGRLAKLADTTYKGNTDMVETDISNLGQIDPGADTQPIPKKIDSEKIDSSLDLSVDIMQDPAFWNLVKESSEEEELNESDQEFLDMIKKSSSEIIETESVQVDIDGGKMREIKIELKKTDQKSPYAIDPHAETQQVDPPHQKSQDEIRDEFYDLLEKVPSSTPIEAAEKDKARREAREREYQERKAQEKEAQERRTKEPTRIFKRGRSSRRIKFE